MCISEGYIINNSMRERVYVFNPQGKKISTHNP